MKNIFKHALPQCLAAVALVSVMAIGMGAPKHAYAQDASLSSENTLTAVSVKKFINQTSDFNIHGISVSTVIKAANAERFIQGEKSLSGKAFTFSERQDAINAGLAALQDEPLPVNPGSIQLQSLSGQSGNSAYRGSCMVHLDPSDSESYAKYASKVQGFDFDARLMKKLLAQHELSHCMYYEKRSAQNGMISSEELANYFDKLTSDEKQTLKTFFSSKEFMETANEQINETYADTYMMMSAAKNKWVSDWTALNKTWGKMRNTLASENSDTEHDSSIALDKLRSIGADSLSKMSSKSREAMAESLAVESTLQSFQSRGILPPEISRLVGKNYGPQLNFNNAFVKSVKSVESINSNESARHVKHSHPH